MNYDKQFAKARKRIHDYIDRGCRTNDEYIKESMEEFNKQTSGMTPEEYVKFLHGEDEIEFIDTTIGKIWYIKGVSENRYR